MCTSASAELRPRRPDRPAVTGTGGRGEVTHNRSKRLPGRGSDEQSFSRPPEPRWLVAFKSGQYGVDDFLYRRERVVCIAPHVAALRVIELMPRPDGFSRIFRSVWKTKVDTALIIDLGRRGPATWDESGVQGIVRQPPQVRDLVAVVGNRLLDFSPQFCALPECRCDANTALAFQMTAVDSVLDGPRPGQQVGERPMCLVQARTTANHVAETRSSFHVRRGRSERARRPLLGRLEGIGEAVVLRLDAASCEQEVPDERGGHLYPEIARARLAIWLARSNERLPILPVRMNARIGPQFGTPPEPHGSRRPLAVAAGARLQVIGHRSIVGCELTPCDTTRLRGSVP